MRYVIATVIFLLTLFAGVLLSGAGHGWLAGAIGCFALAPFSFFSWHNALGSAPSYRAALSVLSCGLVICLFVAIRTVSQETEYFLQYLRVNGLIGASIASLVVLGWLLPSSRVLFHARSASQVGT